MDKKPFEHFNFNPDFPGPSSIAGISKESLKEFEKSEAYKKYVLPTLEREKQLKKTKTLRMVLDQRIINTQHYFRRNFCYMCSNIIVKIINNNTVSRTAIACRDSCAFRNFSIFSLECASIPAV